MTLQDSACGARLFWPSVSGGTVAFARVLDLIREDEARRAGGTEASLPRPCTLDVSSSSSLATFTYDHGLEALIISKHLN